VCPAATILAVLGSIAVAQATPITYVETGVASGTIGASTFTNAAVQLTAIGDTSNVVTFTGEGIVVNANPATMSLVIQGIGTAAITQPTAIYSFPEPVQIDKNFPVLPYVIFGTLDAPPALDGFTGLGGNGDSAFLGYGLQTSLGPITALGGVGRTPSQTVSTSLGTLTFTSDVTPHSEGTFTATVSSVSSVPEPVSLVLVGSGLAALVGRLRLRARK
jgi:hypothetical protein